MGQRGMTLLEVVVVAGIAALLAMAALALAQGGRPFAARSAAVQFDAAFAYAQSLAANSGNGATLGFSADGSSGGFVLTVYSGRPTAAAAMQQAPMAPIRAAASLTEAKLGAVPFTVFLNSAAHGSAMRGTVSSGTVMSSDPGCPTGESAIKLTFGDGRDSEMRTIPCNTAVAGLPVGIGTVPP